MRTSVPFSPDPPVSTAPLLSADPLDLEVHHLRTLLGDGLVHAHRLPARSGRTAALRRPLPDAVATRLAELGIEDLWTHQAEAIDLVRDGRSTVIATGTASGKSLCYQLPIAEAVTDPLRPGTALALFPTKALAQDQLRALGQLAVPGLTALTYDGDTPPEHRTWARSHANVLLTNPEMLHCGLLPQHGRWSTFLLRLRYVVIDELHVLRGVFGTNVAHLLRRLRRICEQYGSSPTFVFSSATIGQPARLAGELCGLDVHTVADDGSPRGERLVALVDPARAGGDAGPRSPNRVTADLIAGLVRRDHRTLAFCRSRAGTEVVSAEVLRRNPDLHRRIRAYRGGYLAAERREIEAQLFSGTLGGVVATSALELGIDVGGLDAVVLNGFPGTIASLWQQVGRAGREGQPSVAVLVAGDDQLDHHFLRHPHEVFERAPEPAVINPANPYVLDPHLGCAAYEHPLTHHDERWWGDHLADGVRRLVVDDTLRIRPGLRQTRAVWARRGHPARALSLRSGSAHEVRIAFADGTLVGTVDRSRAPEVVHPGAVYLHQGRAHRVVDLDLHDGAAIVEPDPGHTYTQARSTVELRVLSTESARPVGRIEVGLAQVEVTAQVTGYQQREVLSGELLAVHDLVLPPSTLVTRGVWWRIPPAVLDRALVEPHQVGGALHAAEHAAIGMLPLFAICDRWDVGGVSTPWLHDLGAPAVVIYDGHPGGAGIADLAYEATEAQLAATLETLAHCGCDTGCPSCVQSPKCGSLNEPLDKHAAARLLRAIRWAPPPAS
jgi:DEAD/DEAH box helicase domain-containing protein